jgi:hypothetical protein
LTRLSRIQLCRRTSRRLHFSGVTRFHTDDTPTQKKAGPPARDLAIAAGRLDDAGDTAWDCIKSNPCGNFSGTSSLKFRGTKGSIGHTFMVCIHTENQNQGDFCPFAPLEISVLHESPLGHLRYGLTDVPPQPNSPPDNVFDPDRPTKWDLNARSWAVKPSSAPSNK